MTVLQGHFPPEFLNRIDETIVFHALSERNLGHIIDLLLERTRSRVRAQGFELEVTGAAKRLLVAHGYQPEFGARPLRRTIQTELDNRIAELVLAGELVKDDTIVADVADDSLRLSVRHPEAEQPDGKTEEAAPQEAAAG